MGICILLINGTWLMIDTGGSGIPSNQPELNGMTESFEHYSIQLDEPGRSTVEHLESPDVFVITTIETQGFLYMDLKIGYIPLNALIDHAYP